MRKLFDTVTSSRAAAYLMAAVAFLVLLSAIVPQEGFDTGRVKGSGGFIEALHPVMQALALDRIYSSSIFLILLALLGVGLLSGSIRRLTHLRRIKSPALKVQHLGSAIFHIALVVILAGVLLNRSFNFEGTFGLTEGQQAEDDPGQYVRTAVGGLRPERFGRFRILLNGIDLEHPAGGATTEAADVTVSGDPGAPGANGLIAINQPLRWNGLEFHIGSMLGYSPEIMILDESGTLLLRSFVRVGSHRSGPGEVVHEDFIDSPIAGQKLRIGVLTAGSTERDLTLALAVVEGENELISGTAAVGDTLRMGELRVAVPRMRRWCYIEVVENPWIWLIFTGFWVGLGAQALSAVARVMPGGRSRKHDQP